MKAIAEFALRGRRQAIAVVVITTALPMVFLLGAAVAGLLFLRRGWGEGIMVLPWALLVAAGWWWLGDPTAFIVMAMVVLLASLLRATISWQQVWVAGIALGTAVMLALNVWPLAGIEQLVQLISAEMKSQLGDQLANIDQQMLAGWMSRFVVGMLAASDLLFALLCLMLARHWQSALYHPGGFREEFHQFRVSRPVALLLSLTVLVGATLWPQATVWLPVLVVPFILAGIGLIHGLVAERNLGKSWLAAFYLVLVVALPYMVPLLILLAFFDVWFDFRGRTAKT